MGLDITALSKVEHVPEPNDDEDIDDEGVIVAFAYVGFERSTRGLVNHDRVVKHGFGEFLCWEHYRETGATASHSFRAGSYSGHTQFRARLAEMVGEGLDRYWHGSNNSDLPFFELINFADNEGAIGPEAARDLLTDFRQWRELYLVTHREDIDRYDDWLTACELAADDGIILFS